MPASFVGARILVAEDNQVNARVATTQLAKLGARVDVAGDGMEAIAASAGALRPRVHGLHDARARRVRGHQGHPRLEAETSRRRTPIVAMTANAYRRASGALSGMDDYIREAEHAEVTFARPSDAVPRRRRGSAGRACLLRRRVAAVVDASAPP
ncbi:MAG: response regulator [Chloroflexota bacterium]